MIEYLILGVIFFTGFLIIIFTLKNLAQGYFGEAFATFFLMGLCWLFCSVVIVGNMVRFYPDKVEKYSVHTKTFTTLKNKDKLSGSFILGTGTINSTEYIRGFIKDENGYFVRDEVTMSSVKIFETEEMKDRAEVWCTKNIHNTFGEMIRKDDCLLKVPKGTILQRMELE